MAQDDKKITIGLAAINIGAIAPDGGMGTDLMPLGYTQIDTCQLNFAEDTVTPFPVEEIDMPVYVQRTKGDSTIVFQVANPSLEALVKVCGGEITGSGDAAVWNAPNQANGLELSMEIIPQQGFGFRFPRVSFSGRFVGNVSKNNLTTFEVSGQVMQPTKNGVAPYTVVPKATVPAA